MAQRAVARNDDAPTVEQLMDLYGLDAEAAALIAAVERGEALVGDVVFEPEISDEEKRRLGLGIPIEERIALARRQLAERASRSGADE